MAYTGALREYDSIYSCFRVCNWFNLLDPKGRNGSMESPGSYQTWWDRFKKKQLYWIAGEYFPLYSNKTLSYPLILAVTFLSFRDFLSCFAIPDPFQFILMFQAPARGLIYHPFFETKPLNDPLWRRYGFSEGIEHSK